MTDRVLQQLGNYCLLRLLGRGGFAEVYLGEHRYLKRRAALKVLHASLEDEDVGKFLAEAQTLARLDHPNIVRVHEFAVEQGTPFLVMDHAPDGTLRHRHPHGSCPSLATIVAYVKQIAAALQYAHNHYVIHRDIKPENMLLGPSQQVMLSDFGIALFAPSPEQLSTQALVGTIPYMAPEQIRGKPTFASDQYALGIVVYEWLCGVRPFEGTPWQIVYQQVSAPPPPLRQHNPSLPQAVEDVVLKALVKDPQERYASVELFAQALEQAISDLPFEPRNPYKGLRAFTQADAADFFGRDTLTQELLDRVKAASTSNARLLTVIGPSGSGKSSVVMAGLLPRLQQGALPTSQHWVYLDPMLPGTHPLEALALTLVPRFPDRSLKSIREDLEDASARGLHLLATRLVQTPVQKVVLLIDQFEELFAQAISEQERQHFINLLITAMTEPGGSVIVLLTLRADCYDRPLVYPALSGLMEGHQKLVLPMEMADLRAVIILPAALPEVQLNFAGDLVNNLLSDVQDQAGALPLLQFTLEQLFARRSGHTLTLAAYREIDGVKGALSRHAESTYTALPSEEHRKLAHALFLRLIDPGFTERDTTRRRAALVELSLPDPEQTTLIQETADAFVAARLLTTNEFAGITTIEVSHEALIREWTRLSEWLQEAREDISLQHMISADAADWVRRERPLDRVYRDTELTEAQAWAGRNVPSADEAAFLQAGTAERQRQKTMEQHRQARELTLQRRVMNRQRLLLAALSVFSVVVILLALVAEVGRLQADTQHQQAQIQAQRAGSRAFAAQANHALVKNQIDRALLLSILANQTYNTYDARDSLLTALQYSPRIFRILYRDSPPASPIASPPPPPITTALAFSPDGQTLLSYDSWDAAFSWDSKTGEKRSLPFSTDMTSYLTNGGGLAISQNGQMAAATDYEDLWVWNTETGKQTALESRPYCFSNPPTAQSAQCVIEFTAIAFSPDGKTLAFSRCSQVANYGSCTQERITLWNVLTNKPAGQIFISQASLAVDLAFSPDGKILASSNVDGTVQLWNVASKSLRGQLSTGDVEEPTASTGYSQEGDIAFSPDGKLLATGNSNGTIILWDLASKKPIGRPLSGHAGAVEHLTFSPDGKLLASGSDDTTVRLWDVATRSPVGQPLVGHTQSVLNLAFSPDGKLLASIDTNGTIILWDMVEDSPISQKLNYNDPLASAVFSSDGKMIIAGDYNGHIILREGATGKLLGTLDATIDHLALSQGSSPPPTVEGLALSPDGRILASGTFDGTVILWDMKTRKPLTHFKLETSLRSIVFNPDGHTLALSYDSGTVLLWDVARAKILHHFKHSHIGTTSTYIPVSNMAFSQDGKILASGDGDSVILWDVATGKRIGQPLMMQSRGTIELAPNVESVAFSPDGHTLASIDSTGTIMLWDVNTRKALGQPLINCNQDNGCNIASTGLAFSPNGAMLASGSTTFDEQISNTVSVTVWDMANREPIAHAFHEPEEPLGDFYAENGVMFGPNGQQLLSISNLDISGSQITLWDVNGESWQAIACGIANRNFTAAEWKQFANGESYRKVCPRLPAD